MENRIIFRERLTELLEAADAAGGVLTKSGIRDLLSDLPLEEEHFRLIYDYLAEQKIRVAESAEEAEEAREKEPEERKSLSFYLKELERFAGQDDKEEIRLIGLARNGDAEARDALIHLYLPLICGTAGDYEGDAVSPEDLIQEGNLGLLLAMQSLMDFDSPAACRAHLLNGIRDAMKMAVEGGQEYQSLGEGLVSRVNHLNEAVRNLERDLGHKVSAEELSAYLEMPLEEIRSLLKVSGDQIELDGGASGSE